MWHRVFLPSAAPPSPAALAARLHAAGYPVGPHFRGDDLGWTGGELRLPGGGTPVYLDRFLTLADDLRNDLNAFAAEIELVAFLPAAPDLMRRVIQAEQLITLRRPVDHADESRLEGLLDEACRFLAGPDGFFQVDGRGWFAADGALLLEEY